MGRGAECRDGRFAKRRATAARPKRRREKENARATKRLMSKAGAVWAGSGSVRTDRSAKESGEDRQPHSAELPAGNGDGFHCSWRWRHRGLFCEIKARALPTLVLESATNCRLRRFTVK
jgi:predicted nucleic acid-binding Zn ribbon protein